MGKRSRRRKEAERPRRAKVEVSPPTHSGGENNPPASGATDYEPEIQRWREFLSEELGQKIAKEGERVIADRMMDVVLGRNVGTQQMQDVQNWIAGLLTGTHSSFSKDTDHPMFAPVRLIALSYYSTLIHMWIQEASAPKQLTTADRDFVRSLCDQSKFPLLYVITGLFMRALIAQTIDFNLNASMFFVRHAASLIELHCHNDGPLCPVHTVGAAKVRILSLEIIQADLMCMTTTITSDPISLCLVGGERCDYCNLTRTELGVVTLPTCGRCKMAWYCSEDCQRKDWTEKNHRFHCRKKHEFRAGDWAVDTTSSDRSFVQVHCPSVIEVEKPIDLTEIIYFHDPRQIQVFDRAGENLRVVPRKNLRRCRPGVCHSDLVPID